MRVSFAALSRAGVLGINRRNIEYVLRWNPRRFYPNVDDKLQTKRLCQTAGIPTPRLLAAASHHFEVRNLLGALEGCDSFVLKPARGAMGNGIVVVYSRSGKRFRVSGGREVPEAELRYHAAGIISGLYALAGHQDVAVVEERLEIHPELRALTHEGVPDLRVIVYRGVPVMAMLRLPTRRSRGRANLHQGAIGVGIDLTRGRTVGGVYRNHLVDENPETGHVLAGHAVPEFARALAIAVAATDQMGLQYVGADVVVDAERGPVILELNARPGLVIQIANRAGLLPRLRAVDGRVCPALSVSQRIALGVEIAGEHGAGAAA